MRCAVTVSLVPEVRGGPFVFWDSLEDAFSIGASLGFDAIEIFPASVQSIDPLGLRRLTERHGLNIAAFGTGAGWAVRGLTLTHPDASIRAEALGFIASLVDLAATFAAPVIVGSMQGRWGGQVDRPKALEWFGEAMERLGERAGQRGTMLLYEPLNRYETNLFNRIGDAATWLKTLRTPHVRLLADLFHMNIEESDIASALREAAGVIGHVHFADSNRRAIGMGHTNVAPIVSALREVGYSGYLSAEVLPWPSSEAAARATIDSFRRHVSAR